MLNECNNQEILLTLGDPYMKILWKIICFSISFISYSNATIYVDSLHWVPDFAESPTIQTVKNGLWSDATIWSTNQVPDSTDIILINASDSIIYNITVSPNFNTLGIKGHLKFKTTQSTQLKIRTILVYNIGSLEIGRTIGRNNADDPGEPILPPYNAEIIYRNVPLDTVNDPFQWGNGLLVYGKISICGQEKTAFSKLGSQAEQGNTILETNAPLLNWQAGDQIVIPDTRHLKGAERKQKFTIGHWEELLISSANSTRIELQSSLVYDHRGPINYLREVEYDVDGNPLIMPHVANLTRTIQFKSEDANGVRGHTAFVHMADVDVRYASFTGMGRTRNDSLNETTTNELGEVTHIGTNQIGKYSIHAHHLTGPMNPTNTGYQFKLIGLVSRNTSKWGITIHDSHYGLLKDNIVYNSQGASIAFEDGSESYNMVDHNMAIRVYGSGDRANAVPNDGMEGVGFWARGPNNYFQNNVATNIIVPGPYGFGYTFFVRHTGIKKIPEYRGQMHHDFVEQDMNALPIPLFNKNEAYGLIQGAITIWWIGSVGPTPVNDVEETIIDNLLSWHFYGWGLFGYPCNKITFRNTVMRGDPAALDHSKYESTIGLYYGDYMFKNSRVEGADIQNLRTGIKPPLFMNNRDNSDIDDGLNIIENSFLANYYNITINTMYSVNGAGLPPKKTIIRNVQFSKPINLVQTEPLDIRMNWGIGTSGRYNAIQRDEVWVYQYNGDSTANFQVFYPQQHPDSITAHTIISDKYPDLITTIGVPDTGMTNQWNWDSLELATAGSLPICSGDSTVIMSNGIVCSIPPDTTTPTTEPVDSLEIDSIGSNDSIVDPIDDVPHDSITEPGLDTIPDTSNLHVYDKIYDQINHHTNSFKLYNVKGVLLYTSRNNPAPFSFEMEKLSKGIYILQITENNTVPKLVHLVIQ